MSSKVLAHGVIIIAQKEMIIPKHRQHANSIERCNLKKKDLLARAVLITYK